MSSITTLSAPKIIQAPRKMLSSNIAALSVDREVRQSQQEPQHTGLGWCRGPRQRTAASTSSAVIAVFRLGADPYVRRIPDIVALTHSASLGFGSSAALQRRRIAASLRDSVEGFFPSWAWEAMKLAMASGVAPRGGMRRSSHHISNSRQSEA